MRLLVLGGTKFLGRHAVDAALARGHEVTLFNRGETGPELHPEARRIAGDRDGGLEGLAGGAWDAVLDTSGYVPRIVRASAELLAPAVGRYVFVSSISAYADLSRPGTREDAPLAELEEETDEWYGPAYGPLKAGCEAVVQEVFGDRATVVRPGLVAGPWDPTGRFTYWVERVAAGGDVLAPAPPERLVQAIDARDLGGWLVRLAEDDRGGVFNAVGPAEPLTMGELLETCRAVAGSDARFVWAPADRLLEQGVGEWLELPLWLASPEARGMLEVDGSRAFAAGLAPRPIAGTVADTLAWARATRLEPDRPAGLDRERERELLAALGG